MEQQNQSQDTNLVVSNLVQLAERVCTNDDLDPKYIPKYRVHRFNCEPDDVKIRVHLENLINTFGLDLVKAICMADMRLVETCEIIYLPSAKPEIDQVG